MLRCLSLLVVSMQILNPFQSRNAAAMQGTTLWRRPGLVEPFSEAFGKWTAKKLQELSQVRWSQARATV